MKKLETNTEILRRNGPVIRSSDKVHGVSPEARRESMVGKTCEKGSLELGVEERGS